VSVAPKRNFQISRTYQTQHNKDDESSFIDLHRVGVRGNQPGLPTGPGLRWGVQLPRGQPVLGPPVSWTVWRIIRWRHGRP